MKVVIFNGSPRPHGNTARVIGKICEKMKEYGVDTEAIQVGSHVIHGCRGCGWCRKSLCGKCVIEEDPVNLWIDKMIRADGILLASPIYFSGITGQMKSFLDRAFYVAWANGGSFRHKTGASFTVVRRAGGIQGYEQLNHYLSYSEMLIASGNYWPVVYGSRPGEIEKDEEGLQIIDCLAENMIYLMKMKDKALVEPPSPVKKIFTNFIREQ